MQCGANGIWDEKGCFVYEVVTPIVVRSSPSVVDRFNIVQNHYFEPEEWVSVDLIRHSRQSREEEEDDDEAFEEEHRYQGHQQYHDGHDNDNNNNNNNAGTRQQQQQRGDGPFLRLSDGSGWILARQGGRELARRIPVEVAPPTNDDNNLQQQQQQQQFWTFYADHIPHGAAVTGIELLRHPNEELKNPHNKNRFSEECGGRTYLPMQKIVCDRKIVKGTTDFYRVLGTCGWVLDSRKRTSSRPNGMTTMIPGDLVEKGLFAYKVKAPKGVSIRKYCHVGDGTNCTNVTIRQGEIIVADTVRYSPLDNGNGPFLRLTDGSGWLFQHKHGGSPLLEEIPITNGTFHLRVVSSNGIKPRGQPIDSYYYKDQTRTPLLKQDQIITCDRKVLSALSSGVAFYRKQGTDFWIFDKHEQDGTIIAEVVPEEEQQQQQQGHPINSLLGKTNRNSTSINDLKQPWNPYYIRGNANGINGLEEIDFDPTRKVLSYQSVDGVTIHVHYETRMIGLVMDNYGNNNDQRRAQHFHRNCNDAELQAILQDPRTYQRRGGRQSSKRARLIPSPINTTLFPNNNDRNRRAGDGHDDCDDSTTMRPEWGENLITPDASTSSNLEDDDGAHSFEEDLDDFDAEHETRKNLWDCQRELQNLRYREGNLLRAIQIHEQEHSKEARKMRLKTEQVTIYRIQQEAEEDRRFRLGRYQELPRRREIGDEQEDRQQQQQQQLVRGGRRRRSSLVFENVYIGSMVGCFLGLALSPVCGPFLVRLFGLEHLVI